MRDSITLRPATPADLSWVNARYTEVNFQHSIFEREFLAIAEIQDREPRPGIASPSTPAAPAARKPVGVGRVIHIDRDNAELGGMYVAPDYRGQGIAEKLVRYLLVNNRQFKNLYCLPLSHLAAFYKEFGFAPVPCEEQDSVHEFVRKKHGWCNDNIQETLLFILKRS